MESIFVIIFFFALAFPIMAIVAIVQAVRASNEVERLRRAIQGHEARVIALERAGASKPPPQPAILPKVEGESNQAAPAEAPKPAVEEEPSLTEEIGKLMETVPSVVASRADAAETPPGVRDPAPQQSRGDRKEFHDIEGTLALKWTAWGGAIALLLAGVFLIRYAAENGALGPGMRCLSAAGLGALLIAGAWWLKAKETHRAIGSFDIDQAPAALAAGGVAILFGAAYGAGIYYALLPPLLAFPAMALVSCFAMGAALYFGPLTAAIGIVGAFATPALVETQSPSLVMLFAYLTFVTGIAHAVVSRTAWTWLGLAVSGAGAIWLCLIAGGPSSTDIWAAAFYMPISAAMALRLTPVAFKTAEGVKLAWAELAMLAGAGLWLEGAHPEMSTRLALFALTPVVVWRAATEKALGWMTFSGVLVTLVCLWDWNGTPNGLAVEGVRALLSQSNQIADPSFLLFGALMALAYAAIGLYFETRQDPGTRWSALASTAPVMLFAVAYMRAGRFDVDVRWTLAGVALAAALTAFAARSMSADHRDRAGIHAAGAMAALALALAAALRQQWLGMALSLMLPALAWIEAATDLRALRNVAMAVMAVASALLLGWLAYDVVHVEPDAAGSPFAAYLVPAVAFLAAAMIFRRRQDDDVVATLEVAAASAFALFIIVQTRLWFGQGAFNGAFSFDEAITLMLAFAFQALAHGALRRRTGRPIASLFETVTGVIALGFGVGLIVLNPWLIDIRVSVWSLACAYLVPAGLAVLAGLRQSLQGRRRPIFFYALVASSMWIALQVHWLFHADHMHVPFQRIAFVEFVVLLMTFGLQAVALGSAYRRWRHPMLAHFAFLASIPPSAIGTALIVVNPIFTGAETGVWSLVFAYLVPAIGAALVADWRIDANMKTATIGYAIVSGFTWISTQVRLWFHTPTIGLWHDTFSQGELWTLSVAWFVYAIGLMALGLTLQLRMLRLASLGVVALVCLKVFLIDMAAMSGLWRVTAFLFLGLALIGLGAGYRRVVARNTGREDTTT